MQCTTVTSRGVMILYFTAFKHLLGLSYCVNLNLRLSLVALSVYSLISVPGASFPLKKYTNMESLGPLILLPIVVVT